MMDERKFSALILTHGRPDNVKTYGTLRKCGYTGRIIIVIDDQDKTGDEYRSTFGDEVVMFSKAEVAKTFDTGDNFSDMRTIVYARNASFDIARKAGLTHFVQLDDDYSRFEYRFTDSLEQFRSHSGEKRSPRNLDLLFRHILDFLDDSGISTVSIAQGGDFLGGFDSSDWRCIQCKRKAMNSFFCRVDRPFQFVGRINEDVNTYTSKASRGMLMMQTNQVSLGQETTQAASGGMTDVYLASGTYVKSFYSVMMQPSSVCVTGMNTLHTRLHHKVDWKSTTPKILRERLRRGVEG